MGCYARLRLLDTEKDNRDRDHIPSPFVCGANSGLLSGYVKVDTFMCHGQTLNVDLCSDREPVCWRAVGKPPCNESDFEKHWTNKVDNQYGFILRRLQESVFRAETQYVKLTEGTGPACRQVSKEDCLAAAKIVGATPWLRRIGGSDSGMAGRPQGCTLHQGGSVEWWGSSEGNAPCGSVN